ncbi:MarR family winged helix-turn-helix transcriptional regulator [Kineococcus sp. R86509]|uniref:MarR family winged helix-turn-helix transcriptional regulator n=1 Tax=Kineococcus sp. R86509 TaxID=3093851 RepID=UPI0036D3CA63
MTVTTDAPNAHSTSASTAPVTFLLDVGRLPGVREDRDVIARSPFSGSEVGHLTLQAGLSLLNVLDGVAGQVGLQGSDLRAMYLLHVVGDQSAGELARRMQVPQSCVTLIAKRLEADGLLVRQKHPSDGRKVVLALTSAGEKTTDAFSVLVRDRMRKFFAPLSAAGAAALAALLAEVVEPHETASH